MTYKDSQIHKNSIVHRRETKHITRQYTTRFNFLINNNNNNDMNCTVKKNIF